MLPSLTRRRVARLAAVGALVAAMVALLVVLLSGAAPYTIHAQFEDAGQLVNGDLVEVGGRTVGKVGHLGVTPDGLADAQLNINDGSVTPFRSGTTATIRSVGLASITNRYIDIVPGPPNAAAIPGGGVLPTSQTRGIVDLDTLLNALDPHTRARLQSFIASAASIVRPPAGQQFNQAFHYLEATSAQTFALGQELVHDQAGLERLIATGADVASTLASRSGSLAHGVTATAAVLREVAGQRAAVSDGLARTPPVLTQGTTVLEHLRSTLDAINPAVRDLRPVAPRLARVLRQVVPVGRDAIPAVTEVRQLLPSAREALSKLPPLEQTAVPAMQSGEKALRASLPILTGFRPYAPDLIAGQFNGFGGSTAGYYDANGHYARVMLEVGQGGGTGPLSVLTGLTAPASGGFRSGLTSRCPGGAAEPAADASNPWVPPDVPNLCNPQHDHQ